MKKIILIAIILILGFLLVKAFQNQENNISSNIQNPSITSSAIKTYKTQEDSQGEVIVKVKPISLSSKENIKFEVTFNTHTVELDKDLKDISVLIDNKGNEYKPISWTGETGGHHLSGDLIFSPISKDTKSVKLTIKGIDNIDRVFEWEL